MKETLLWVLFAGTLVGILVMSKDGFYRYPCQDPDNWDKDMCKMPRCDVTRTCPEHIFKGQRDPRLGPPKEAQNILAEQQIKPAALCPTPQQGVNCGK